ncbi:MAG TPA: hypothetical protein VN634_16530 [Candidatus Limnocylindrales bacterium]|nr:hypothetical protein [Candidatus Limnocylindrales bacterium]
MKYDRFNRFEGTSWAFWQFNEYETQINSAYWSGVAAVSRASYEIRRSAPPVNARVVMHATGTDAQRISAEGPAFVANLGEFLKWNRASFILAATGAFETYIWRVVLTALMSDPAALHGKSRAIDGATWLKLGLRPDYSDIKKRVTKDTWFQRYAAVRNIFGEIPALSSRVPELDQIRIFRNNAGHAFGRDLTVEPNLTARTTERMRTIDDTKFKEWLGVISKSAKAIDSVLVKNHIGDFEPMIHFHNYYESLGTVKPGISSAFASQYKLALAKTEGHSKGNEYALTLIRAYLNA